MNDLKQIFNKSNMKILKLIKNKEGLYIREIAEALSISPFAVHNSIKMLKKNGFVSEKRVKNRKTVYLDRDNALLKKIISLINIQDLLANRDFKRLRKAGNVGVYGSFASGEDTRESDIDLWVYPSKKISHMELREITMGIEREFEKEVKLVILGPSKIKDMEEKDPEFYYRLKLTSFTFGGDVFD